MTWTVTRAALTLVVAVGLPITTAGQQAQSAMTIGTRVGLPPSGYQASGRDPFVPLVVPPRAGPAAGPVVPRAPGLAGQAVADVELKGIIASGSTRLALLAGADGRTYLARVQDRLHDAVVRRIEADAVVLLTTAGPQTASREVRKVLRPVGGGVVAEGGGR